MSNQNFAQETTGVKPPQSFILDASVLDMEETYELIREDVKQNRVSYEFPEGLNQIDLFEECRALTKLNDFDTMYDVTMQMLAGKPVSIFLKDFNGSRHELCTIQVVDRYMDLRGVDIISDFPYLVVWLTEFIAASLSKKFPLPMQNRSQP